MIATARACPARSALVLKDGSRVTPGPRCRSVFRRADDRRRTSPLNDFTGGIHANGYTSASSGATATWRSGRTSGPRHGEPGEGHLRHAGVAAACTSTWSRSRAVGIQWSSASGAADNSQRSWRPSTPPRLHQWGRWSRRGLRCSSMGAERASAPGVRRCASRDRHVSASLRIRRPEGHGPGVVKTRTTRSRRAVRPGHLAVLESLRLGPPT